LRAVERARGGTAAEHARVAVVDRVPAALPGLDHVALRGGSCGHRRIPESEVRRRDAAADCGLDEEAPDDRSADATDSLAVDDAAPDRGVPLQHDAQRVRL